MDVHVGVLPFTEIAPDVYLVYAERSHSLVLYGPFLRCLSYPLEPSLIGE